MSESQAQIANQHIVSQVLRKKMGQDARTLIAARARPLLQSTAAAAAPAVQAPLPAPGRSLPARRPHGRTVTFAAADDRADCSSKRGQGNGDSGCALKLQPSELLQEGVKSMGGALEVSPSAFGGFTVRDDCVTAMRLSISHAKSMPTEGEPAYAVTAVCQSS